jgi:homoserine kinase type II
MAPLSAQITELIESVLEAYDITPAALHDIRTGRVNKHWRVIAPGGAFVLRRYTESRTLNAIAFEHDVLRHLAGREWPVAPPIAARDGQSVVETEGRSYSLFPLLPGKPAPYPNARYTRLKGRLLARLHGDLASFEAPDQREGFGRAWELDVFVRAQSPFATFNELLMAFGQEHPELARAIRVQKYAMLRELAALGYGELPAVPCHFDFHHDNLLFQRGALTGLLDLDLAHLDTRVADIASSISLDCLAPPAYNEIDPEAARAFVAGYTEHTPLRDDELQLIVPLVRAAIVSLVAWRLAHWAVGERVDSLRSIQRSVTMRFPNYAARRDALEAAVLQAVEHNTTD